MANFRLPQVQEALSSSVPLTSLLLLLLLLLLTSKNAYITTSTEPDTLVI
jgi:hypothetical protein